MNTTTLFQSNPRLMRAAWMAASATAFFLLGQALLDLAERTPFLAGNEMLASQAPPIWHGILGYGVVCIVGAMNGRYTQLSDHETMHKDFGQMVSITFFALLAGMLHQSFPISAVDLEARSAQFIAVITATLLFFVMGHLVTVPFPPPQAVVLHPKRMAGNH